MRGLRLLAVLPLAGILLGCAHDTASYSIGGDRKHFIMLTRSQNWFWDDAIDLAVLAQRGEECQGGLSIQGARLGDEFILYKAPDEYPEPIYILKLGTRHFAISDESCRAQEFAKAPADLGEQLGTFKAENGKFAYMPKADGKAE